VGTMVLALLGALVMQAEARGQAQTEARAAARVEAESQTEARVELRVDPSQAEAVLDIVVRHQAGEAVPDEAWEALFATEPYRRLKQRESDMGRSFTDDDFRAFVLSPELAARAAELRRTLDSWAAVDLEPSAHRVLAYLPAEARIRASVYPVIKPQTNSFVYDLRNDPAIFLYLDPAQSPAQFENIVAHELHHVGFASVPPPPGFLDDAPAGVRTAVGWMTAFGEGLAMLAAAGDVDTHPHEASPPADRERWDRDMADHDAHLRALEAFFLDVIEGRLASDDEVRQRAFAFFGEQGPWYTVGYGMAVAVERRFGRDALIECMLDPRLLLARYNDAAAEAGTRTSTAPARWSPHLLELIGG
jgi:hypothetical protein